MDIIICLTFSLWALNLFFFLFRSAFFLADETMQILYQAESQLQAPNSATTTNMPMAKKSIPDFPNIQDVVQMAENIQRRLLGWGLPIRKSKINFILKMPLRRRKTNATYVIPFDPANEL